MIKMSDEYISLDYLSKITKRENIQIICNGDSISQINSRLSAIERMLKIITNALKKLTKLENEQMTTLDELLAKATELVSLEDSVKVVLAESQAQVAALEAELVEAKKQNDQTKIDEINDQIVKASAIAKAMLAVAANTPAAVDKPAEAPAEAPKAETPAEAPAEAPKADEPVAEAPAEAPKAETPAEAPAEAPKAETPAEVPAEDHQSTDEPHA